MRVEYVRGKTLTLLEAVSLGVAMDSGIMLTEQVEVVSIHGEKLNFRSHVGQALPLTIPSETHGTITFKYLSDGQRFDRHVPLDQLNDFRVGQQLMAVIS
jgi:hypothetical protein